VPVARLLARASQGHVLQSRNEDLDWNVFLICISISAHTV
jgi:hypothetical protein